MLAEEALTGLGMQLTPENACALVPASEHTETVLWLHTHRVTRRNTSVGTNFKQAARTLLTHLRGTLNGDDIPALRHDLSKWWP